MLDDRKIKGNILFSEKQKFRVKWLWAILLLVVLSSMVVSIVIPIINKNGFKETAISLAITVPLEALLLYLCYTVTLETVVSSEGVYYRWTPFFKRYSFIDRTKIDTTKADDGPVLSYGYHYIPGYGKVNNMGPGKGMRFKLKNDKQIFIGTNNINAFKSAIDKMIKS